MNAIQSHDPSPSPDRALLPLALAAALLGASCERAYFAVMESLGVEKRGILVERVEEARDAQEDAREEFQSALDELRALVDFQGSDLEDVYEDLDDAYRGCEEGAREVHERIESVDSVSSALFSEWSDELELIDDPRLRSRSLELLIETRRSAELMLGVMRRAESRMDPVLEVFRGRVLFLKHNLNAQALSTMGELGSGIENDVAGLIAEMEASIAEANAFIESMS